MRGLSQADIDCPSTQFTGDAFLSQMRCAQRGRSQIAASAVSEAPADAPVPADLSLLSDNELTEAIREHLKEDGRIDMEELHVVCRKGAVYLSGSVPSEAEHQILLTDLDRCYGL